MDVVVDASIVPIDVNRGRSTVMIPTNLLEPIKHRCGMTIEILI